MPEERLAVEFVVEDVTILFRNFAGRETQYNREGDRNFVLVLSDEMAEKLIADEWNVRTLKARNEEEVDRPVLDVTVKFGKFPPRIIVITNDGKTRTKFDEDMLPLLDTFDVLTWDIIINPSFWSFNGKSGVKAYLKSAFITVREDALERKYGFYADTEA